METAKLDYQKLFEDKSKVPFEFNRVAKKYDLATRLSQGYQSDLQRSVDRMNLKGDEFMADLCCGTSKSTICCINNLPNGKVIGIDNSQEMLNVAKNKTSKFSDRVEFILDDVMNLDIEDNTLDAIFMAYGIRNMPDYEKSIKDLFRILKPGGKICFHEYSLKKNLLSRIYWKFLGYVIVIPVSTIVTGSSNIFKYLVKSVSEFLCPEEFLSMLKSAGFVNVKKYSMPGWRMPILHSFVAEKPNKTLKDSS